MSRALRRRSPSRRSDRPPAPKAPAWLKLHLDPAEPAPVWLNRFDVGWLALVAIVLSWIVLYVHRVGDYSTESDFYGGYATGARLFQRGAPNPARYGIVGPGYDLAIALAGFALRDLFLAAKVVSVVSALVVLLAWRRIARETLGPGAASWLIVLVAVNAVFLRYGWSATTDMLAAALQAGCLAMLIAGRGRRAALGAGALAALAFFTRYTSLYLLPAGAALLAFHPREGVSGRTRGVLIFLGGFALIAVPWTAFSLAAGFVPASGLFQQFGFYTNPTMARNLQDQYGTIGESVTASGTFSEAVRRNPLGIVRQFMRGVPDHLLRDGRELLRWPPAMLSIAGLALALASGASRRLTRVALPTAMLFLTLAPIFYSDRYSLPLLPAYLVLAALFLASPRFVLEIARPQLRLKFAAGVIVAFATAFSAAMLLHRQLAADPVEVVDAGRALARLARPGDRVMSRKGQIGYYSGLRTVPFPPISTTAELGEFARRNQVRFLYYGWYEASLRPEFAFLLDSMATVPGLERVFVSRGNAGVLYRVGPDFGRDSVGPEQAAARAIQQARVLTLAYTDSAAAPFHVLLAADALDRGRIAEVFEHAEKALRWRRRDPVVWTLMGDAQRASGRAEDAALAYANALALDPTDERARFGMGLVQIGQGRSDLAAETWRPLVGRVQDPVAAAIMESVYVSLDDKAAAEAVRRGAAVGRRP